jgi:hypothetical protein
LHARGVRLALVQLCLAGGQLELALVELCGARKRFLRRLALS